MTGNSTRALLWLGGAARAVAAAIAGAAGLAAAVFVAAWAFAFGDHPWPAAMPWIIGAAAAAGGAAGAVLALMGTAAGARRAKAMAATQARARVRRWAAAGVALLAALLAAGAAWIGLERDAAGQARLREQARQGLAAAVHQPSAVALDVGPETISVLAVLQGRRSGRYRWQVRLAPALTTAVLAEAEGVLSLQPGAAAQAASFETAAVLATWRARLLGGGPGSVDQSLIAEVGLEPELTAAEQQVQAGGLPLRRTARASVRLRFVADAEGVRLVP